MFCAPKQSPLILLLCTLGYTMAMDYTYVSIYTYLKQRQPVPAGGAVHAKETEVFSLRLV